MHRALGTMNSQSARVPLGPTVAMSTRAVLPATRVPKSSSMCLTNGGIAIVRLRLTQLLAAQAALLAAVHTGCDVLGISGYRGDRCR